MIVILSHRNNLHKAQELKEAWLNHVADDHLFVYGDPSLETELRHDPSSKALTVKCPDNYDYLTLKLVLAFRFILENPQFSEVKGIIKVDDDVTANVDLFNKWLSTSKSDYEGRPYIIHENTASSHHQSRTTDNNLKQTLFHLQPCTYCLGGLYYLSRKAVEIIVKTFEQEPFSIYSTNLYEDYTFGEILNRHNIRPTPVRTFTEFLHEFLQGDSYLAFHDKAHKYSSAHIVQELARRK